MRRYLSAFLSLLLVACFLVAAESKETPWKFAGVSRIVAIGDVHGDYDSFVNLLRQTGLVDAKLKWSGKSAHLVQAGDVVDRGPQSRKALELLMALEKQASKAKGHVHALIGNHEAMNIYGDLRFTSPEEFASYTTERSAEVRDHFLRQELKRLVTVDPSFDENKLRHDWYSKYPLGFWEHRLAFAQDGVFGKWLRSKNAIVQLNDTLFLHGGISLKYASQGVAALNDRIRMELGDFRLIRGGVAEDPEGPLWFRGLSQGTLDAGAVDAIFQQLGVSRMVVAHTVVPTITPRYNERVWCIDTGMLEIYNGGNPTALIIENGKLSILERGKLRPASQP